MANPFNQAYTRVPSWPDAEGIVRELMENAAAEPTMDSNFSPNFFEAMAMGEPETATGFNPLLVCPTPPDSVSSVNSPSPCAVQNVTTSAGVLPEGIPSYVPMNAVSSPGQPSSAAMLVPCRYQPSDTPNGNYQLSASLPVSGADHARRPTRKPQLTSAHCSEARIKILNPRLEYDKIQRKHGPRGKISEQRILNGQVDMQVETNIPLQELYVYVMREFEAEKKLMAKDPSSYGVGPTRITNLDITQLAGTIPTYICKFDLDSVYKTPDGKEIYKLEKTKGLEYNRFQLKVCPQFINGTTTSLYPYEFVLKSAKTVKQAPNPIPTVSSPPQATSTSDDRYSRFICQYLEAEFARIKTLEVEQIKTTNHDIAYYIKRKYPDDENTFEEGDVVGFFESPTGDTVIDLLTSENAHEARLAGVISRSAYLKGKAGRFDRENDDADLVCIIGEIQVKVIGKVRTGELIYTCPSDKFPGTATASHELGNRRQTLIGYAMGESSGPGVSKVDCLVSLILSIGAKEQLRALEQLRHSLEEMKDNLTISIDTVGVRITRMQRGWRGMWKKLLAVTIFLAVVGVVCGLMLAPNSPYVKQKCRADSIKGHYLSFKFYPPNSDDEIKVTGLEFTWKKLKKKLSLKFDRMNGTDGYRYFLNKERCETGGIRSVASWLDPAPTEPKVNVLAVNSKCSKVYYHSRKVGEWFHYEGRVGEIQCIPLKIG